MSETFSQTSQTATEKSPMKVMAAACMCLTSGLVWEAADSGSECEEYSGPERRGARRRVSDPLVSHLLIAPNFAHRTRTPHLVSPLSEAACLTVCEGDR